MAPLEVFDVLQQLASGLEDEFPVSELTHAGVTVLVFAYRPDDSIHHLLFLFILSDWTHFLYIYEIFIGLEVAFLVATFQENWGEFCL